VLFEIDCSTVNYGRKMVASRDGINIDE